MYFFSSEQFQKLEDATENGKQQEAIKFVEDIWGSNCPRICMENPVGALSTRSKLGKPTQYIEPYFFGHAEQKKTGLWLKGLPKLEPTKLIDISHLPPKQRQRLHWLPPSKDRWKLRSLTYLGVAEAMAEQWGKEDSLNISEIAHLQNLSPSFFLPKSSHLL